MQQFNYMMLSRLQMDCNAFLGTGNSRNNNNHLWGLNIQDHIKEMFKQWDIIKDKPEWISLKDINNYKKDMLNLKNEVK